MSKDQFIFNMACFSTNSERFRPLLIIEKFMTNSDYDYMQKSDNALSFYYKLETDKSKQNKLLLSIYEILNFDEAQSDICTYSDSYLIILDLESDDTYEKLDTIINYMRNICDMEKGIFVLGVYEDVKNTKQELDEENIIEYLDGQKLIYEYVESNVDSIKDLVKTVDFILKEGIKKIEKKYILRENKSNNESESKSKCVIF